MTTEMTLLSPHPPRPSPPCSHMYTGVSVLTTLLGGLTDLDQLRETDVSKWVWHQRCLFWVRTLPVPPFLPHGCTQVHWDRRPPPSCSHMYTGGSVLTTLPDRRCPTPRVWLLVLSLTLSFLIQNKNKKIKSSPSKLGLFSHLSKQPSVWEACRFLRFSGV